MDILQQMRERAKLNQKRIVLPEGDEPRTLEAADIILRDKLAQLILIGDENRIAQMAQEKGLKHISDATIFNPKTNPKTKD